MVNYFSALLWVRGYAGRIEIFSVKNRLVAEMLQEQSKGLNNILIGTCNWWRDVRTLAVWDARGAWGDPTVVVLAEASLPANVLAEGIPQVARICASTRTISVFLILCAFWTADGFRTNSLDP